MRLSKKSARVTPKEFLIQESGVLRTKPGLSVKSKNLKTEQAVTTQVTACTKEENE